jgi:hypothetical protein
MKYMLLSDDSLMLLLLCCDPVLTQRYESRAPASTATAAPQAPIM